MGGSNGACSVTVPSWGEEAQAESSKAIAETSTPYNEARLFTRLNLLIDEFDATSGI